MIGIGFVRTPPLKLPHRLKKIFEGADASSAEQFRFIRQCCAAERVPPRQKIFLGPLSLMSSASYNNIWGHRDLRVPLRQMGEGVETG